MFRFNVIQQDTQSYARLGRMQTAHGVVPTPIFMAVGTLGTVKGTTPAQLKEAGVGMVLGNTYHLMLRPGAERIARLGGLHKFMGWDGPILTDSGGFQVFSLAQLTKRSEEGIHFRSHIDGSAQWLDAERSMEVQRMLGSDVVMAFDDCTPHPATREQTIESMALTHAWADRSLNAFQGGDQALFGIVQGGMYDDLRAESARILCAKPFHGFAIGGLSVGEPKELMYGVLRKIAPLLPNDKPRYLMGVGTPADLINGVAMGVDMFDCVMPTRNARNGQAFTSLGTINIKSAEFRDDGGPLDSLCECYACTNFTRAYLHHLYRSKEMLSGVLITIHNLSYYQRLMAGARAAIKQGTFLEYKAKILATYLELDIQSMTERLE